MAPHAGEERETTVARLERLLEPSPGRLAFAARIAFTCALTALVVQIYQTPSAALAVYVVFFAAMRDRAESVIVSIVLCVLISLIVGLVILLSMAVMDRPLW